MGAVPIRVLLVDDDEDDYVLTRDLLSQVESTQYHLDWVDSYDAALSEVDKNRRDVYLVDYYLGERNGLDLLREMIELGCQAPIILLTGRGDHDADLRAMMTGAADFLVKGQIDSSLLERSIRYSVERSRAE